jgi:tetratricopeptide (TPR) repeat protein
MALALCGSVFAQTTKPKVPPSAAQQAVKELADKIVSSDPAVRAAAVEQLRQQAAKPGGIMDGPLAQQYLPALLKAGLNQEVADFAMQGILTGPQDAHTVEVFHKHRVAALLAMNRPEEALAEAKSLYNVCTMKGTGDALVLMAQCLQAVHPEDKTIAERFKLQQVAGSTSSPQAGASTQPSTQPAGSTSSPQAEPNMLKAIRINAEPYLESANLPRLQREAFPNLVSRGNLLLEADKLAEAKQCFEAAYPLAGEKDQAKAAESLARVMKAEDGTVGRANAYILSLRPATQPTTQAVAQAATQP